MPWFKVDDDLAFHRKIVKAGNAAMGLWVRSGAWCAQQLTDGFVPDDMIALLGTPSQRRKLISAGLWIEVDGGCVFHEWSDNGRQPTSQSVREKRADAAKRQQEYRDKLHRKPQASGARNAATHTSVTQPVTPVFTQSPPTRPVPSSPNGELPPDAAASDEAGELVLLHPPAVREINAHDCGTAFVDAFRATGAHPTERQIKQAVSEAKQLLDAGNAAELVLSVAESAGTRRRPSLLQELSYGANQPARRSAPAPQSLTAKAVASADAAWDEFEARHGSGNVHPINARSQGA